MGLNPHHWGSLEGMPFLFLTYIHALDFLEMQKCFKFVRKNHNVIISSITFISWHAVSPQESALPLCLLHFAFIYLFISSKNYLFLILPLFLNSSLICSCH
ncbi:hypothetical protein Ancab_001217 [Ancistrocladus abbreviatus]